GQERHARDALVGEVVHLGQALADGLHGFESMRHPCRLPVHLTVWSRRLGRRARTGPRQPRVWPSPRTTNFVVVSCSSPMGPRAWSFWVEMPISAPNPNSSPSTKRVEAFTRTAAASTSRVNRSAAS